MSDFLARVSHFSAKRLALLADELNERVQGLEQSRHEPIAIVGIGCRFPGGADTPEKYWQLLRDGIDAVGEVPPDRWAIDDYFDPDPDVPGKMSSRWGGFLGPVDGFDAHFFGISPREAHSMDPQQRLLLEVSWRALEHAGISPQRLEGSRSAVYLGLSAGDYYQLLRGANGLQGFDAYTASGTAHSIASGRLSYTLGLRGASVSIDTACSSSLVAIHQALNSLRRGECDLALAGGVNLILGPDITIALSKAHMMAPDGHCKAFDSRADGFVRGEGCGILVLKRLSQAQADGDRVIALLRGSAANQDGRSNGLTAPNGPSQEAVIREALADARCNPHELGFVEAHGTGTALGDPIEVQALQAVLGAGRPADAPLLVGSVKASIGHLEAAAGVAGVIKVAMALQHGEIPAQLHLQTPNPYIPWDSMAIRVPTAPTAWPAHEGQALLAGVSSFGFSGTNVHLVMQAAPLPAAATPAIADRALQLLVVSARSEAALHTLAAAQADALARSSAPLADIAYTLGAGRAHFAQRAAVLAATPHEATTRLASLATTAEGVHRGVAGLRAPRVAFLFTGQGAQYAGMARTLYATEPVFRDTLNRCDELLRDALPRPLLSVLFPADGEASPIDATEFTQPALFSVEYALAQLWISWGVRPAMVMGHSVGEYVAACVAGVFSLDDGLALIAARGRLMGALPRLGAMAAVMADPAQVAEALLPWRGELGIAAVNGPQNVVISGHETAVSAALQHFENDGVKATRLNVSHAFHSPLMAPMLDEFTRVAESIRFATPSIDLVSNVSGELIGARAASAAYWREHVLAPVQFASAVKTLAAAGCQVFLEVGPHPTLLGMARECIEDVDAAAWLPSLRRSRDDTAQMLDSLAALYVRGVEVDWTGFAGGRSRQRAVLPGYPFERERYWVPAVPASVAPVDGEGTALPPLLHPLLGWELAHTINDDRLFETRLGLARLPWLADHRIHGALLLPSPAWMEMALAAADHVLGAGAVRLDELVLHQPLALEDDSASQVQFVVRTPAEGGAAWRVSSRDCAEGTWRPHASGRLSRTLATGEQVDLGALQAALAEPLDIPRYYEWLLGLGLDFGPNFRAAQTAHRRDGEVLVRMQLPTVLGGRDGGYHLHPALLDACLHLIGAALPDAGRSLNEAFLLLGVERIEWFASPGREFWNHIVVRGADQVDLATRETFRADLRLIDDHGRVCMQFSGLQLKRANVNALLPLRLPDAVRQMLHEVVWRDAPSLVGGLGTAARVGEQVLTRLPELATRHRVDAYADFLPKLDALAAAFVVHALRELDFAFVPGESFDAEALRQRLGVSDRHQRLFARMLDMLGEDGVLQPRGTSWQVLASPARTDLDALYRALLAQHPDCEAELVLTRRCAEGLADVLRGRADPLPLLFPEGSLNDTERLYQNSPPAKTYNGLIADVLEGLLAGWPSGRRLRVLEIGAGTGSTTAYLLPSLRQLPAGSVEYRFTDVSPLFLKRAREKFADADFMRYELLDIGTHPVAQGFGAASFDIIVGANVLHATPDLGVTLSHVRTLLAPGGRLVLLEGATPQRFGDLTVGLLEGWWSHTDTARRHYALMPRRDWLALFAQQGFGTAVALPGEDSGPVLRQQAVYLAEAPVASAVVGKTALPWLIQPDRGGLGQTLAALLRARGDAVEWLSADTRLETSATAYRGVVHLAALDAALDDGVSGESLMAGQQALIGGALRLVQPLAARAGVAAPPLWFVTRGAQAVAEDESADPAQATLWGLSHGVAIEHPELACRRIDLDPTADHAVNAAALVDELDAAGSEDQLALRAGRRLLRRLVHRVARPAAATAVSVSIDAQRSYLVTGGLRGLGLLVAHWLVERGARHLVLMGRQAPQAQAQPTLQWLQAQGARVLTVQGDVSRAEDVRAMLGQVAAQMPPLAGVVHAAGLLDDGVITSLNWSRVETVMGPKVGGSWHLHTMLKDLEFMVLFASGASLAGSPGQANHAAANAFEDALAWYRQARGLPTVSINWGPWAEIGAAAERAVDSTGLKPIAPADGLAALAFALRSARAGGVFASAQLGVLRTDWSHLIEPADAGRLAPLFTELLAGARRSAPVAAGPAAAPRVELRLRERLLAAMPNRRKTLLRDFVRQQTVKVLGLAQADELDIHEPLRQLGLDSLMAVELRNLLGKAVERSLPATLTFDHPTVNALVEHLAAVAFADELAEHDAAPTPAATDPTAPDTAADSFDELSQDELMAQLESRLDLIAFQEKT